MQFLREVACGNPTCINKPVVYELWRCLTWDLRSNVASEHISSTLIFQSKNSNSLWMSDDHAHIHTVLKGLSPHGALYIAAFLFQVNEEMFFKRGKKAYWK